MKTKKTGVKKSQQLANSALEKIKSAKNEKDRIRIIVQLIRDKSSWTNHVLLEALDDRSKTIRERIVKELASREDLDPQILYDKLKKPPWYVKNEVLKVLGMRKNTLSIKHIKSIIEEPNVDVRKTATDILGEIGGSDAIELLIQMTKDKNPFIRRSAEKALQKASDLKFT